MAAVMIDRHYYREHIIYNVLPSSIRMYICIENA